MLFATLLRATSALDAASESLVNKAINNISTSHSLTTILIAHRLSTIKQADRVVFMENGVVAEQGTFDELARDGTRFANLVQSQMLMTSSPSSPLASSPSVPPAPKLRDLPPSDHVA